MADDGQYGDSLQYYEEAKKACPSPFAFASARRPYGRALILAGNIEQGREEMLAAAKDFKHLKHVPGLDPDRMQYNCANVFRRMIWAQIHVGSKTHLQDDFRKLKALTAAINNRYDRNSQEDGIKELEEVLPQLGIRWDEGPVEMEPASLI